MNEWAMKRFWADVAVLPEGEGFAVKLDGRGVKTPAKRALVVPTQACAELIAEEWAAQEGTVDPTSMPHTRMANAAIDKVAEQFDEVAALIAVYGGTDLLCYRATDPAGLVARQSATWDPFLDWCTDTYGARLTTAQGVMFHAQDPDALTRLHAAVQSKSDFELAALHDLVSLTGSLVLGLAAAKSAFPASQLWEASRVDESWQIEQWGDDEEAAEVAQIKEQAFHTAYQFNEAVVLLPSN